MHSEHESAIYWYNRDIKLEGDVRVNETKSQLSMIKLGVLIGMITGLLGVGFNFLVKELIVFTMLYHPLSFEVRMLFVPIIGGFLLGLIHKYYIKDDHYGFDVAGVMEEIRSINQFIMRPILALAKTVATILTLSIGWSAGRQGPIVYIGGAVGSWVGYTFNFTRDQIKILVACGVAGALSGVFNEPIFAILFVLEVILHKDYLTYFTPVTVSAIASAAVTHMINGNIPFIELHGVYDFGSSIEHIWMVALGVIMGLVAVAYIRSVKSVKKLFKGISSPMLKGLLGGVIIAVSGYFLPDLYDIHLGTTARIVSGEFGWKILILLIICKMLITGVTLGAGGVGGVFSPGLFIGAASGYLVGVVFEMIPFIQVDNPSTYALVGMVAMFAGFGNAPLTATLLAVELTGDERLILPFLLTTVIASVITEAVQKDSIYGHSNFVWADEEELEVS